MRFPIAIAMLFLAPASAVRPLPPSTYLYGNTIDVGAVEPEGMLMAYAKFRALAESGAASATLRIDSPGGSIFLGNRWIREMEDVKKAHAMTVTCIVDGTAYSMAAVILESPVCDVRLATTRSTVLFHNGSATVEGNAKNMLSAIGFLEALNTSMALVVSQRIGCPLDWYRARIAYSEWIMAVPEALMSNVIDGVVSSLDIAPPEAEQAAETVE